jgi:hypothetical protein
LIEKRRLLRKTVTKKNERIKYLNIQKMPRRFTAGSLTPAHLSEKSWIEDVELQSKERPVPNFHSLVKGSVDVDRIIEEKEVLDSG